MPHKPMIAVIDDEQPLREAINGLLRSVGFDAEAFSCAEDFLNAGSLHRADCLIMDVQMPGMSGPEFYRRLVTYGVPVPTILITAYPDEKVRTEALKAGVACYLTKPFDEDDLLSCIRSVLGQP